MQAYIYIYIIIIYLTHIMHKYIMLFNAIHIYVMCIYFLHLCIQYFHVYPQGDAQPRHCQWLPGYRATVDRLSNFVEARRGTLRSLELLLKMTGAVLYQLVGGFK